MTTQFEMRFGITYFIVSLWFCSHLAESSLLPLPLATNSNKYDRERRYLNFLSFWDNAADDDTLPAGILEESIGDETVLPSTKKRPKYNEDYVNKHCITVDECRYCTAETVTTKGNVDEANTAIPQECFDTGRRQRYECSAAENSSSGTPASSSEVMEVIYQSCKSTPAEDYYAVLRMQIICLALGIFSLRQVNKQKRLSASMFDQRRYGSSSVSSSSSSSTAPSVTKLSRKTSDAAASYMPLSTSDNDDVPGSASKTKSISST